MKRKYIYYSAICLLMLSISSCENWLNISPKSEIKADKLYETEAGFKDALIGLYIGMTDRDAYGMNLSWSAIEYLGGQYVNSRSTYIELQKGNYEHANAKNFIDRSWAKEYNIIAEANLLLESIEKNGRVLNPTLYQVIKGEALAVRAMCHFDLIRLFAKGNLKNNPSAFSDLCIPYVTSYSKSIQEQKSYRETLQMLHQDINNALECLKSDPLCTEDITRPEGYDDLIEDVFFAGTPFKGRETRLSYVAVQLLNARVYLWEGNETEALKYAESLIGGYEKLVNENKKEWATEAYYVGDSEEDFRDYVFQGELLFALDAQKLHQDIKDAYPEELNGNSNYDRLEQSASFVEGLFTTPLVAETDLRYINHWNQSKDVYLTIKVRKTEGLFNFNYLPLMRISEAYLIAAECLMTKNKDQSIAYLNFLKKKRNIKPANFLSQDLPIENLQEEIIKDYRREFTQEGQLFFCYKRLGLKSFVGKQFKGDMGDAQYRLPYPAIEEQLGQRN